MKYVNINLLFKYFIICIILLVISCTKNNLKIQCLNIVILLYELTAFLI